MEFFNDKDLKKVLHNYIQKKVDGIMSLLMKDKVFRDTLISDLTKNELAEFLCFLDGDVEQLRETTENKILSRAKEVLEQVCPGLTINPVLT